MKIVNIKLNTLDNAEEFANICNEYDYDINIQFGKHTIDAKSLLGILSFDLKRELQVTIVTNDDIIKDKFYNEISKYKI